jgi:hypothetical protein
MRRESWMMFAFLGLALAGCGKDQDEDGFKGDDDCDDLNAAVNPRADEVCDGVDNNCNGKADEGLILEWYADKDNDQYGDPETVVTACIQPAGYVDNAEDCNDASESFHPMAQEDDCEDPSDYNCDGSVGYEDADADGYAACNDCDDSDADTFAPSLWYVDYDGDGYGSDAITQTVCAPDQEDRWAENADDCDDLIAAINPDATEVCNEADDNCDGTVDEFVTNVFYEDADGDGFGNPISTTDACEVPEGFAVTDDDCEDSIASINPGAEEVCDDGVDNNCDGEGGECTIDPEASDAVFWGASAGDEAGISVSGGGDLNGDGYDDLVIGAKHESSVATQAGAAYVIYGGAALAEEMTLDAADVVLTGQNAADKAGRTVRVVPDVNDDGTADLLIGAPSADPTGDASGKMYIAFGGGSSGSLGDADALIKGRAGYNYLGLGMTGGDFNGDGDGDVLIGAPGNDVGGSNRGTIYVLWGPVESGEVNAATFNDYITGQSNSDEVGDVLAMFDHNADGIDDLLVGAPDNSEGGTDAGSVYIVHGPITGAFGLDMADVQYTGESASDKFGVSVSSAGDIDDDGNDDFIAGAAFDDAAGPDAGAAYVVLGGAESGGAVDEFFAVKLTGEASEDQFGAHAVANGDIDNDGNNDMMVSAPFAGGTSDTGSVYVFYGALSGTFSASEADVQFDGDTLSDQLGNSLAFVGDVDGDGNSAILIGGSKKDTSGADAGGAYLMLDIGL